jgi:hypothetical protein
MQTAILSREEKGRIIAADVTFGLKDQSFLEVIQTARSRSEG